MSNKSHSIINFQIKKKIKDESNKNGQTQISSGVESNNQIKWIKNDNEKILQTPIFNNATRNKTILAGKKVKGSHLLSNFNKNNSSVIKKKYNGRVTPNSKSFIQKQLHLPIRKDNSSNSSYSIKSKINKHNASKDEDENDLIEDDINDIEKTLPSSLIHDSIENVNFDEISFLSNNKNVSNKILKTEKQYKRKFSDIYEDEELTPRKRNLYSKSQITTPKKKSIINYNDFFSENINQNGKKLTQLYFSKEVVDYNKITSKKIFKSINKQEIKHDLKDNNNNMLEQFQQFSEKLAIYQQNINNRINNINIKQKQINNGKIKEEINDENIKERCINIREVKIFDNKEEQKNNEKGTNQIVKEENKVVCNNIKKEKDSDNKLLKNIDFNILNNIDEEKKDKNIYLMDKTDKATTLNLMEIDRYPKTESIEGTNKNLNVEDEVKLNSFNNFSIFGCDDNNKNINLNETLNNMDNNLHKVHQIKENTTNNINDFNKNNESKIEKNNSNITKISNNSSNNIEKFNNEAILKNINNDDKNEVLIKKELTSDVFNEKHKESLSNKSKPINDVKSDDADYLYDLFDKELMNKLKESVPNVKVKVTDNGYLEFKEKSSSSSSNSRENSYQEGLKLISNEEKSNNTSSDLSDETYIHNFNLPFELTNAYLDKGIEKLYKWQSDCLRMEGVLEGKRNLIFSAPTSAGKTMVSEILMIKKVIETGKKALMILPYISIVNEKTHYYQDLLSSTHLNIVGYFGNSRPVPFEKVDIGICTIEKANSLINRLIEEKNYSDLGAIVVDELHMIGDEHRGYLLELLLTKLRYVLKEDLQIIGMSATLPNIDEIARWLNAALYITDYRPVPLEEFIVVDDIVYDSNFNIKEKFTFDRHPIDPTFIVPLAHGAVCQNNSVLIFCSTKYNCEQCVRKLSPFFSNNGNEAVKEKRKELISKLSRCPAGLDSILEMSVICGIAYHHSGLTMEERELLEEAFRQGTINILIATSTLASGVNLPARRVIFDQPFIGIEFINSLSYTQMKGRAGRKGKDTFGESFLICSKKYLKKVKELIKKTHDPVKSCLTCDQKGMKRALLEIISSGIVQSMKDVKDYIKCTLLYYQEYERVGSSHSKKELSEEFKEKGDIKEILVNDEIQEPMFYKKIRKTVKSAINYLLKHEFIKFKLSSTDILNKAITESVQKRMDNDTIMEGNNSEVSINANDTTTTSINLNENSNEGSLANNKFSRHKSLDDIDEDDTKEFISTSFGRATVGSSLSPEESIIVYKELKKAMLKFVLLDELHMVYHVTPIYSIPEPDWNHLLKLYNNLSPIHRNIANAIDLNEGFIIQAAYRRPDLKASIPYRRFYSALMLNDLIHEVDFGQVVAKYQVNRGHLQSLQVLSSTFAGMVTIFCQRMGWNNFEILVQQFQDRLIFGIQKELMELVKVPHVKGARARALYDGGVRSIKELGVLSQDDIFNILCKAKKKRGRLSDDVKRIEMHAAKMISRAAKQIILQQQEELERSLEEIRCSLTFQ
ncbi:P-loop containing nucleoside triphosphate hydrolase protein [Piromyces finnis]|uniref:p-loop containing nucleoside triphosphate hydrolase protein n=1 Tax=Piromyces finnis TaxID=1754191 RepID=A0A1Y1UWL8_9FUNG|nr:P-loop containing nucleoside triphosphate hydrolase protein [Piromyces finnis]|eukprot:ORX42483.1 P-loop containing nucleoside triphosphate hydrolase protein [Piromyces finnis]